MPKHVAFLRAINVGGHTVKMDQLRRLFEDMGFLNVETFIASGNVIFDSTAITPEALEKKIENHLHAALGYEVATFIRSTTEVAAISQYQPFLDSDLNAEGHILYVAFLTGTPSDEAKHKLLSVDSKVDEFHISGREVYWLCRKKFSESEFSGARLEKTLGMRATVRNITTVRKMASKYS